MRKLLLSAAIFGGVFAIGATAHAAPTVAAHLVKAPAVAQTIQYYEPDWREREAYRRRREEEEYRRREAYRQREEWRERRAYGAPPPAVYGAPPPVVYGAPPPVVYGAPRY